jgi:hypothetical protein
MAASNRNEEIAKILLFNNASMNVSNTKRIKGDMADWLAQIPRVRFH